LLSAGGVGLVLLHSLLVTLAGEVRRHVGGGNGRGAHFAALHWRPLGTGRSGGVSATPPATPSLVALTAAASATPGVLWHAVSIETVVVIEVLVEPVTTAEVAPAQGHDHKGVHAHPAQLPRRQNTGVHHGREALH
jgi:hypothetical protein